MADNHNDPSSDRSEIAFFDVETTVPTRPGQGYALLEFGSILVCPRTLVEVGSYSTLVKPNNRSLISALSVRCNGITPDAVVSAPSFAGIADTVYDILHGRIWAGHNIVRFDCVRIKEAFEQIGRLPPEPKGIIDSLVLLTQKFGRRAGDMKMASLATYFGLGKQTHRSLEDVRMNLEVVKYCATVLFLESSLPDIFTEKSWVSPNATTRSRSNGKSKLEATIVSSSDPSSSSSSDDYSLASPELSNDRKSNVISKMAAMTAESSFDLHELSDEIKDEALQTDVPMEERTLQESNEASFPVNMPVDQSGHEGFLDPDAVSVAEIKASFNTLFRWAPRMELMHKNAPLKLCCSRLKVRFGIGTKFVHQNGRPRLNFVVAAPARLCSVLDACDSVAYKLWEESGSNSEWRKVVRRTIGFDKYPTVRLHIPPAVNSEGAQYATEICQKDPSGTIKNLEFRNFDAAELGPLFFPGAVVDAYLSVDPYDYQQNAGLRLVAKKLILYEDGSEKAPKSS